MPSSGIEVINPLRHISEAKYSAIWQKLFATMLAGFWGRLLFLAFIMSAVFFGIRRRNASAAVVFALGAVAVAFGASLVGIFTR